MQHLGWKLQHSNNSKLADNNKLANVSDNSTFEDYVHNPVISTVSFMDSTKYSVCVLIYRKVILL